MANRNRHLGRGASLVAGGVVLVAPSALPLTASPAAAAPAASPGSTGKHLTVQVAEDPAAIQLLQKRLRADLQNGIRPKDVTPQCANALAGQSAPAYAYDNPLTRATNPSTINANRNAACANVAPSCDEYPMASTYQGAGFQPDFSTASVPASANSSQGGILSQFYGTNRVLDGDPFWVSAQT